MAAKPNKPVDIGRMVAKPRPLNPNAGKSTDSVQSKAEQMFAEMIRSGKVKNINKAREQVAKKTGEWPNGMTN